MIVVPDSLKTEIAKLRGRRLFARCRIDYSDSNIDNTITASGSSLARGSYFEQAYNGIEDVTKKWCSLDGSWELDGTFFLAPETEREKSIYEVGWWGTELSNPDGTFQNQTAIPLGVQIFGASGFSSYNENPGLFVNFIPRTFSEIRISFDNARMEYAIDFDVEVYDIDQTELYCLEVRGNTGTRYVTSITQQSAVAQVRIKVITWSLAGTCAKIAELYTSVSETYTGDDILNLQVIENRELSDESIPLGTTASGQCVITLVNKDRKFDYDNTASKLFNVIREGNRIVPEIGDGTNWIPLGTFFAKAWDISKRSISLTVTGLDRMERLGNTDYSTNQIIQAPADQSFAVDDTAEWAAGELDSIEATANTIRLVFS